MVAPDQDGFDRLGLFIVPAADRVNLDGSADAEAARDDVLALLETALRARLPRHSLPRWIRQIDELPRTPTGKVQRFRLRELLLAEQSPASIAR